LFFTCLSSPEEATFICHNVFLDRSHTDHLNIFGKFSPFLPEYVYIYDEFYRIYRMRLG
jgi:hypothetical protein